MKLYMKDGILVLDFKGDKIETENSHAIFVESTPIPTHIINYKGIVKGHKVEIGTENR